MSKLHIKLKPAAYAAPRVRSACTTDSNMPHCLQTKIQTSIQDSIPVECIPPTLHLQSPPPDVAPIGVHDQNEQF